MTNFDHLIKTLDLPVNKDITENPFISALASELNKIEISKEQIEKLTRSSKSLICSYTEQVETKRTLTNGEGRFLTIVKTFDGKYISTLRIGKCVSEGEPTQEQAERLLKVFQDRGWVDYIEKND